MPTGRRRNPLVLVSTAAVVDNVLSRSCSELGQENEVETDLGLKSPSTALTAGLLLWNGRNSLAECSSVEDESTAIIKLLERRGGGNEIAAFDELTTVGVSASLLRRLSLSSGAWVILRETSTNLARPARVVVLDPPGSPEPAEGSPHELSNTSEGVKTSTLNGFPVYYFADQNPTVDDCVAYLSPVLALNLGIHVSWLEFLTSSKPDQKHEDENLQNQVEKPTARKSLAETPSWCHSIIISPFLPILETPLSENKSLVNEYLTGRRLPRLPRIKHASHMRIGMVRAPSESLFHPPTKGRQAEIDSSLREFFKLPRFLAKGDVFSVQLGHGHGPIEGHQALYCSSSEANSKREHYYKVLALEPSTEPFLCVSHNHTALVLAGSLATQLPPLTRSARLHKVFLRTPAVRQLSQLLAPCLHPRVTPLELRLAVLIHGPSGSGKQTVVRLAAEDLGVNVLEFNCYDFVGATEGKTTAALVEAFKSAKRYSPSILLLRRFEALAKSSSGGTSPGHQQGAVSRVTSVLKTCIQVHLPNTIQEDDVSTNLWTDEDESTGPESKEFGSIPLKFAGIGHGLREGLVLVVAACESAENLTPSFRRCFTHELAVGMPDEDQRLAILHHYLGRRERDTTDDTLEESLKLIASQTSGLTPRDLRSVAADTGAAAITRLIQDGLYSEKEIFSSKLESHPILEPKNESKFTGESYPSDEDKDADMRDLVRLTSRDLEKVLERVKLRTASAIGTPKVPNVKWEDVGGLEDVKKAILDTVQLPLQHRELFASGLRQRSGVLLYGPPGTGKTLLAKAVATECSLNFLSVKGPELINMYIGESEKNVREIFHKARAARPCVVFFDELDALAPARGASGDSGGVMDRVVSQLLAEIDGVSDNSQDLFIIGASNRPDLIDPALLRPGRFDKLLYVGVSSDNSYRERVLQALTRKFILDKNVSLKALSERCPVNYTGADMYALCADAWHQAVKREVSKSERRRGGSSDNVIDEVVVKQEDFMKAMGDLTPSLSKAELDRYERLRLQFQGQGQRQRQASATLS
ncbi:peroxin-6 [Marchantia polymorpha subsp. ruderalis]|uniref:Peroxisomal ATPase PEX6 n=2 Tax=Marchantia polymorpha TaxID=3197 RepID=A0AAF6AZR8_MARPO|nr:hypothetical protein MARPO_0037s0036 [Marchantia polymorpha]PTQ40854.1 hypothetical protein MARPO_0037s0036 [Marchantia polymorpha]BBN05251.1 hypothetical protein Mp_3g11610 [Marchantia polymorpha subsp. ruderalis]BBN05252.1 hypothetical protein Mp_3g11610 [Marchantia polymorpha subsp. ruderalis]|eukprot:PTQ40853.1 hypothetical protein MARPO_0037s0036 [Marchantia polymorpha]